MKALAQKTFINLVYFFLYFPILVLVIYSINDAKFSLQWHGFSMQWYAELFHDRGLWSAFFHSVILGFSASIVATTFGLLTCVHFFLFRNQSQRWLNGILLLLIIIPDLVLGVALLIFLMSLPFPWVFSVY
nr:hypothetical protein [Legionella micdadei]